MAIKVYKNSKIQNEERYLQAFITEENEELEEKEINLDEFKQVVIENEFIDINELKEKFNEVYIIPHDAKNEKFVTDEKIQHIHIYVKTDKNNNAIYSIINNIKKIDKEAFIKQLKNLDTTIIHFTNNKKLKEERIKKMKKTLLHYNAITNFTNEIPKFTGAVIVKENGEEVAIGDRKSGFSKNELENLKNNTSTRIPLYIQYILTFADDITTEERKKIEENLKKEFKDKVDIISNNPKNLVFTIQNFNIQNDILKIQKITNTHLKVLKFLNENNLNVINMNAKKEYIFKHIKYKDEDVQDINKYIIKPNFRTIDDYIEEKIEKQEKAEAVEKAEQAEVKEKQEVKEEQKAEKEININEIKDENIKTEIENIEKEIANIKQNKYLSKEILNEALKELETKKTELYNKYLEKLEEEKKQTIANLKQEIEKKEKEINELKANVETLNNEVKELNEKEKEHIENIKKLENEVKELKEKLENANLTIDELQNIKKELNKKIETLNNEVDKLNKEIQQKDKELLQKDNIIKEKEKENAELKAKNEALQKENASLKFKIKEQNTQMQNLKEELNEAKEVIKQKEEENKQLRETIKAKEIKIKENNEKYKKILNEKVAEIKKLKEENKQLKQNIKKADEILAQVQNAIQNIIAELENIDLDKKQKEKIANAIITNFNLQ